MNQLGRSLNMIKNIIHHEFTLPIDWPLLLNHLDSKSTKKKGIFFTNPDPHNPENPKTKKAQPAG